MLPMESERIRLYNELLNKVAILRNELYDQGCVDEESELEIDYKYCIRKNYYMGMEGEEDDEDDEEYEAVADAYDEMLDETEYELVEEYKYLNHVLNEEKHYLLKKINNMI